jgi:hypothetical protein
MASDRYVECPLAAANLKLVRFKELGVMVLGADGPDEVGRIEKWHARSQKAEFHWERKRVRRQWTHESKTIPCKILVPCAELFSLTAYKPGDYKQFFDDPRTRVNYLKWADKLLTAEEWHNGNVTKHGRPVPKPELEEDEEVS